MTEQVRDVLIVGAGPSGSIASAILQRAGYDVLVLERESFPRFSIGESLLPQCMKYIREAGLLPAIEAVGFQRKNGALFLHQGTYGGFDFCEQFSRGDSETFQVQRAQFDKVLADEAENIGVDIRYQHEITAIDITRANPEITCKLPDGNTGKFSARFLLDASGFGRVLPRFLNLEYPSEFPTRTAMFTHIEDNITDPNYDRNKILITIHPEYRDVWFWLIPFSDGRASIGVVAESAHFTNRQRHCTNALSDWIDDDPTLKALLGNSSWDTEVRQITGYSANVKQMAGRNYALLGNAGEFLDPIFSSGVTIAMHSASLAAGLLIKQFKGENVDWELEYAKPLSKGVDTFRAFVTAWYDGSFQDIIFHQRQSTEIRKMICSVLAGYAWDETNPYVQNPRKRLDTLSAYCKTNFSQNT
ncbi:MAG: tryptophan 7-halogenase [Halioglobus sp.]|nr:tryptophan 7-halogenase [Halioglobus sp.]